MFRPSGQYSYGEQEDEYPFVVPAVVAAVDIEERQHGRGGSYARRMAEGIFNQIIAYVHPDAHKYNVDAAQDYCLTHDFLLIVRQLRFQGIYAEESHVGFDLNQEIGQDSRVCIRVYAERVHKIKDEDGDSYKKQPVELPGLRLEHLVEKQHEQQQRTNLVHIVEAQIMDSIVEYHAENKRKHRQIKKLSVNEILHLQ